MLEAELLVVVDDPAVAVLLLLLVDHCVFECLADNELKLAALEGIKIDEGLDTVLLDELDEGSGEYLLWDVVGVALCDEDCSCWGVFEEGEDAVVEAHAVGEVGTDGVELGVVALSPDVYGDAALGD